MVQKSLGVEFSIQNTKFGVDSLMGSFKTHSLLKEINKFLIESELLVVLNQVLKVVRKHDNLHGAHVSSSEFLSADASKADLFPHARDISLLGSFKGSLILLQLD